jgi:uncharacterized protein YozE (UPF0346 family)
MNEPRTFWQWLKRQDGRHDWIGDLAHDAIHDASFPKRATRYRTIAGYLMSQNACHEARTALAYAYREWSEWDLK